MKCVFFSYLIFFVYARRCLDSCVITAYENHSCKLFKKRNLQHRIEEHVLFTHDFLPMHLQRLSSAQCVHFTQSSAKKYSIIGQDQGCTFRYVLEYLKVLHGACFEELCEECCSSETLSISCFHSKHNFSVLFCTLLNNKIPPTHSTIIFLSHRQ